MTQGKQLSKKMMEIIRSAQVVKSHAYNQPMSKLAELHMQSLTILVREAKEIMEVMQSDVVLLDLDPDALTAGKIIINNEEEDKEEEKDKS